MSDAALKASISMTPNSATYANPDDASDRYIDAGDWIHAKTDTANNTKNSVDLIKTSGGTVRNVIVPLFDSANLGSTPQRIRVSGFALVQVTGYTLNTTPNNLTFTFVRLCDSAGN